MTGDVKYTVSTNVITCVKFLVDRFRGYGVLTPPKFPFPIDLLAASPLQQCNALPCDTVKSKPNVFFAKTLKVVSKFPSNLAGACSDYC